MTLQLTAAVDTPFIALANGAIVKVMDVRCSTALQTIALDYAIFTTLADFQAGKAPVLKGTLTPTLAQVATIVNAILTGAYTVLKTNIFPSSNDLGLP